MVAGSWESHPAGIVLTKTHIDLTLVSMTFHLLSLPHTQVTAYFSCCAFTQKVRLFGKMLSSLGHTSYLYAGDMTDSPVDELVMVYTEEEREAACEGKHYSQASFDQNSKHWSSYTTNVIHELNQRIQPKDFIICFGGYPHKRIADAFPDNLSVEPGIGYGGAFAKYKVFESYAWMHAVYAQMQGGADRANGLFFDDVIPGYIDSNQFEFKEKKDDYYLYLGRLIDRKGVHVAAEACKQMGKRLILAGPGEPITDYGEYVGAVGPDERKQLLANATALLAPTLYLEPFGNMVVEAQMSGTPTITTDWGAFIETNPNGVTGYRCRMLKDFCKALEDVKQLNPLAIHQRAKSIYDLEPTSKLYASYFKRLSSLYGAGWYEA